MTDPKLPHGGAQLGAIEGPLVMIGMGSIGRATLPLLDRHIAFDKSRAIALDPLAERKQYADEYGIAFQQVELTPENYVEILTPLLTNGGVLHLTRNYFASLAPGVGSANSDGSPSISGAAPGASPAEPSPPSRPCCGSVPGGSAIVARPPRLTIIDRGGC